jgi:hypothetical protein
MYYEDLTEYSYSKFPAKLRAKYDIADDVIFYNVGWLDVSVEYKKGFVGEAFLTKFIEYLDKNTANMMRGVHDCQFCERDNPDFDVEERILLSVDGSVFAFGCKEVFVFGEKCVYLCPDMIFHYMKEHAYVPPDVFIEAVVAGLQLPLRTG